MFKKNFVFLFVYFLTFIFLIFGIFLSNGRMIFISLLTLILFFLLEYLEKLFKLELSFSLKLLLVVFIFSAQVFGEILNFYFVIPFWDNILHFIAGFISSCFGFSIIYYWSLKCNKDKIPLFISFIFLICFSISISVLWEFFEFSMDSYLGFDMQKDTYVDKINTVSIGDVDNSFVNSFDNILYTDIYYGDEFYRIDKGYLDVGLIDTMEDMFFNLVGAFCFGFLYLIGSFIGDFKFLKFFCVRRVLN